MAVSDACQLAGALLTAVSRMYSLSGTTHPCLNSPTKETWDCQEVIGNCQDVLHLMTQSTRMRFRGGLLQTLTMFTERAG